MGGRYKGGHLKHKYGINSVADIYNPEHYGGNFHPDRQINQFIIGGGFEPQVYRYRWTATGGSADYVEGPFRYYDTITDGYYDGATIRIYRVVDGAVQLIRKETIPEGGFLARGWTDVVGGDLGLGYVPSYQKSECTDGRRALYYQQIDLENDQDYYYIVKAVDAAGNESDPSNEVTARPLSTIDHGPKIITVGLPDIVEDPGNPGMYKAYDFTGEAVGGTSPLIWSVELGSILPAGLTLNNESGRITGQPVSNAEATFTLRITDCSEPGRWDTRIFKINAPKIDPVQGDTNAPSAPQNVQAIANKGSVTLTWDASPETDLVGYEIYRSKFPSSEHYERINFSAAGPVIQEDDDVYVDMVRNWRPTESIVDRVLWERFSGINGWLPLLDNLDWRSWPDPIATYDRISFGYVPHPGTLPPNFENHGKTCLVLGTDQSELMSILQYRFGHPGSYYPPLKRNHTYQLSMWMRQEGIAGAEISFNILWDYSYIHNTFASVDGVWRKYEWDFTTGPDYPNNFVMPYTIEFNGPGTLWIDNVSIHDTNEPVNEVFPEVVQSYAEYNPGALRIWSGQTNGAPGTTLENWTNPEQVHMPYSEVFALPIALKFCKETGATPWLIVGPYMNEEEWKGLIDYLAGDASTEYGAKRIAQRGGNTTPWTEEFDTIRMELGNETWNALFDPWTFEAFGNGTYFGQFGEYWFNKAKESPSWHPGLEEKIEFALGNWTFLNNGTLQNRGPQAMTACPTAHMLVETLYNGGWEVGYIVGGNTFNDKGIQDVLMFGPRMNFKLTDLQCKSQALAAEVGVNYDLGIYESGPGYDHMDQQNPVANMYGRSLASGIATLDSHLYTSFRGFTAQCFFLFRTNGFAWSSHNLWEFGRQEQTAWQGLKMRNTHAHGDMVVTYPLSAPTQDFPQEDQYAELLNVPMIKTYAFRDADTYAVFILSRKLDHFPNEADDGYTPVTLRLPFTNPSSITLYKVTGDPRDNNLGGIDENGDPLPQQITEQQVSIPVSEFSQSFVVSEATTGEEKAMPPGSVFLYVFEGTTTPVLPANPQVIVNMAPGQAETASEIKFIVFFDRPVSGFGDSPDDVVLGGTANPTTAVVVEPEGYHHTVYEVLVSGMEGYGTITVTIPEGAAIDPVTETPNDESTSADKIQVRVKDGEGNPYGYLTVSAYTSQEIFAGKYTVTALNGIAYFDRENFTPGDYQFKIEYKGYEFWSDVVTPVVNLVVDVVIEKRPVEVTVSTAFGSVEGAKVLLVPENGIDIGEYLYTDTEGKALFEAPVGFAYSFRVDFIGHVYLSDAITINAVGENIAVVNMGGGLLQITLQNTAGGPLVSVPLKLFDINGAPLGLSQITNASGMAEFEVTEGSFKVQADYLDYFFLSDEIQVIANTQSVFTVPHQQVEVNVQGLCQGVSEPMGGVAADKALILQVKVLSYQLPDSDT